MVVVKMLFFACFQNMFPSILVLQRTILRQVRKGSGTVLKLPPQVTRIQLRNDQTLQPFSTFLFITRVVVYSVQIIQLVRNPIICVSPSFMVSINLLTRF